ncbi:hypothetical protein B0T22DRAFT_468313 [Podospora appendiculata]|uniref:Uncharacterized protein n=1 Tax=Podospora appendiculata TaxID=314037 RepID=A0AAE1C8X1_9PEZI|nr:hypothetical protein B0T22DRAFT_468313 [Podospora appendiculata]
MGGVGCGIVWLVGWLIAFSNWCYDMARWMDGWAGRNRGKGDMGGTQHSTSIVHFACAHLCLQYTLPALKI